MSTLEVPNTQFPVGNSNTFEGEKIEQEPNSEQGEVLYSATKFAEYLTSHWPQVDDGRKIAIEVDQHGTRVELPELPESMKAQPRINYYISGSLAVMLLAQAERFTELDEAKVPDMVGAQTREVPEAARAMLASFARPIGDLDYVPSDHYKANPARLKKGGGGPSFDEIPDEGQRVLKKSEGSVKVMCDPVEAYGAKRIAKIQIGDREYYIARPDTILAYKVLHLVQNYDQKPDKFNVDFSKLLGAMREMYGEEELLQITHTVLTDYEDAMEASHIRWYEGQENTPEYDKKVPKLIETVLANQQISPEIRTMLESLRGGAERSTGTPLEFDASEPYWNPYPSEHPGRQFLEALRAIPLGHYERAALEHYSGDGDKEINKALEEGRANIYIPEIDQAMDKVRLPQPVVVYRGEGYRPDLEELKAGAVFQRLDYTSTTLDQKLAHEFNASLTVLKIDVPKGTPVAVPSLEEAELLLPHGSKFEVIDVMKREEMDGTAVIHVRLLPQPFTPTQHEGQIGDNSENPTGLTDNVGASREIPDSLSKYA